MAKTISRKRAAATSSAAALAAAMLAAPAAGAPAPVPQEQAKRVAPPATSARDAKHPGTARSVNYAKIRNDYYLKFKGDYAIAGRNGQHVVFEDSRGNLFYIDSATGDQKFVSRKTSSKVEIDRREGTDGKHFSKVRILGIDDQGRLIMSNPKGEKFYLDSATGDIKLVNVLISS